MTHAPDDRWAHAVHPDGRLGGDVTPQPPSGTLMKSGGNALDPFGSWSVVLKNYKAKKAAAKEASK